MSESKDQAYQIAERVSDTANVPSTSADENNENDLHLKSDKAAFIDEESASEGDSTAKNENNEELPAWFDSVKGAALQARASFPDQIDYYEPEDGGIV